MLNVIHKTPFYRATLAVALSTTMLAGAAQALETPPVSEVTVGVSVEAAQDANAAAVYDRITADLAEAISERVTLGTGADAYDIKVDIRRMALDGDTLRPGTEAFNQLEGVVVLNGPQDAAGNETLPVRISAVTGEQTVPAGFIELKPGTEDFYNAMVNAFAENVAEQLSGVYTGG